MAPLATAGDLPLRVRDESAAADRLCRRGFLLIALMSGMVLVFMTPPFQAPDEPSHFYRAYQISEGTWKAQRVAGRVGGVLPRSLAQTAEPIVAQVAFRYERKTTPGAILDLLHIPLNEQDRAFTDFPYIGWYSPVTYVPQAIGIRIGRVVQLSPVGLMYCGRVANLLFWVACMYACLRLLPVYHWTFFLLALMPMALFLAASLSADAVTTALTFLFVGTVLHHAAAGGSRLRWRGMAWLAVLPMLVALAKGAYTPVLLLLLLIPAERFGSAWRRWGAICAIVLMSLAAAGLWGLTTRGFETALKAGCSPRDQLMGMLHHPLDALLRNFHGLSMAYVCSIIGKLGWFDTRLSRAFVGAYAALLVVVSLNGGRQSLNLRPGHKWLMGAAVFLSWVGVNTLIYLMFTTVGDPKITGLQGRYLVPVTPLMALLLYRCRPILKYSPVLVGRVTVGASVLSCLYVVFAIVQRYYVTGG
jgi:uncharacterized membrane protein